MFMDKQLIVPAFYLPPISYFKAVYTTTQPLLIEQREHFPKQTYRTRASIHSANGKLDLIIPVKKGEKGRGHTPMKDVRISYEADWQRLHWMSLQTAYRTSAFFEFYEDELVRFYEERYAFLLDYNIAIFDVLTRLLKLDVRWDFTNTYETVHDDMIDLRSCIHPKTAAVDGDLKPYYQVFSGRNGFLPDLSIVDLLFNQGPQSKNYL